MKIICTKNEFELLVRNCAWGYDNCSCDGCIFETMCSGARPEDGTQIMSCIEDICEVSVDG